MDRIQQQVGRNHRIHGEKMAKRNRTSLTATLLCCGLVLCCGAAHAAPVTLDDREMDRVLAGTAPDAGGVVVGNSSTAIFRQAGGLELNQEAQKEAKGLNLVNSNQSAVANTLNLWDGSGIAVAREGMDGQPELEINQGNQITQTRAGSGSLAGYSRPEADRTEILNRSGSKSSANSIVNIVDTTNRSYKETKSETKAVTSVNTGVKFRLGDTFHFEGHLGQGVAAAGYTKLHLDGGSADIAMTVGGGIKAGVRFPEKPDLIVPVPVLGDINFGDTSLSAGINASANLSLVASFELPTMDIEFNGAGCGVVMGSCSANSTSTKVTKASTDTSVLEIRETHQSGQSEFNEVKTSVYRSPFELGSARGDYIVVDNSTLELDSDVYLELSDEAQKEIKGLDVVNAIGSTVANATNIARTPKQIGGGSKLVLNQFNIVNHGH